MHSHYANRALRLSSGGPSVLTLRRRGLMRDRVVCKLPAGHRRALGGTRTHENLPYKGSAMAAMRREPGLTVKSREEHTTAGFPADYLSRSDTTSAQRLAAACARQPERYRRIELLLIGWKPILRPLQQYRVASGDGRYPATSRRQPPGVHLLTLQSRLPGRIRAADLLAPN